MDTMGSFNIIFVTAILISVRADSSVVDIIQNMYKSCLQNFRFGCVKPIVLAWANEVSDKNIIKITEDLILVKKYIPVAEADKNLQNDIFEKFEDFLQTHNLIAKAPSILSPDGPLGSYVSRHFQPTDISVPLAVTGKIFTCSVNIIYSFIFIFYDIKLLLFF
ncbi:hypothetical protein NQ314_020943 [Rhamnusium bicolor]|uniref:Uncharacterized protein n=1 Tax=Rhamnusium bicolor TaxID=1586634 RepID=A0AAV8WIU4_9CUCU|nr:hypothetical protein NQ314_020943 [Rhamnusium bicolor]